MKIKKCPDCIQYTHFDAKVGIARCWNCGLITDFSQGLSTEQKVWRFLDSRLSVLLTPFAHLKGWKRCGRIALVGALPFAVVMLLLCNSLQISIVDNPTTPFVWIEIVEDTTSPF